MSVAAASPWMGLRAALLLARGREDGAALIGAEGPDDQRARARHSFLAMLFCVPVFLSVQVLGRGTEDQAMAREFTGFVLGWLGYAVLSYYLAARLGRAMLWPRFVALWNWCNLVQYLLMATTLVPSLLGAPAFVVQATWLVAIFWSLWLQWSATRLTLALPGGPAALLVAADMALGLLVLRLTG